MASSENFYCTTKLERCYKKTKNYNISQDVPVDEERSKSFFLDIYDCKRGSGYVQLVDFFTLLGL